ncbi:MAG TPA: YkvA family protein [Pontibacter sp.]
MMPQLNTLKQKTHSVNAEIYALYLSLRDARVKWYVRLLLAVAVGYVISPIDLVPDLVPVFGFLDDVVVVTLGVGFSYQLLSKNVLAHARLQAYDTLSGAAEGAADAYKVIAYSWVLAATVLIVLAYKMLSPGLA